MGGRGGEQGKGAGWYGSAGGKEYSGVAGSTQLFG